MRGALLPVLVVTLALAPAACGAAGDGSEEVEDPHAELRDRLGIEADRPIHSVSLGGRGGDEHVVPTRVDLRSGDVVEFVTADGRVHTVRFPPDSLGGEAADFLRRTGQLESPPLVERGARFVLTFRDAPSGRYPFRADGGGGVAWGVLVVDGG